jgi:hypothetical protein
MLDNRTFRAVFLTVLAFTLLAGDVWRYTVSWYGFGVVAVALTVVAVLLLAHHRDRWAFDTLPVPLLAFLALATVSLAWSFYPGSSAIGLLTTWMTATVGVAAAVAFSWSELLAAFGVALRVILGASILFELFVSLVVRDMVLPFWVDYPSGDLPLLLFWSRNWLFTGGPIQGVVGNSSLLAFAALLGLIVFGLQRAAGRVGRLNAWFWMLLAVATIALTRSATSYVAVAVLGVTLLAVWLIRSTGRRALVYGGMLTAVAVAGASVAVFSTQLLALVGKSPDLTGRLGIWEKVIELAQQRPVAGWGWVSYWTPWAEPFDDLVIRRGVVQLHAHNAWLDVWLQLGILGLVVFGALVLTALVRAWILATERPQTAPGQRPPFTVISVLPLLLLVALLVQSLAESRLLVEYGLWLLVVVAVKTRQRSTDAADASVRS